ncbi:MAG: autotransporter-associated beta strand repeat-containing protein [Chthoniobacteraceae bacterium]
MPRSYTAAIPAGSTTITVTPTQARTLAIGATVSGTSIFLGTTIQDIDYSTGVVTLDNATTNASQTSQAVTFTNQTAAPTVPTQSYNASIPATSTTITVSAANALTLVAGSTVTGSNIAPGTTIQSINTTTGVVTLSLPTTNSSPQASQSVTFGAFATQSLVYSSSIPASTVGTPNYNITVTPAQAQTLVIGSTVSGTNIETGSVILAVDPTTGVVTLNLPTSVGPLSTQNVTFGVSSTQNITFAGSSKRIVITNQPTGFINQGTFFNGSNYAYYEAAGISPINFSRVRGINYGVDPNSATQGASITGILGTSSNKHVQVTGDILGQGTQTLLTLNLTGSAFTTGISQTPGTTLTLTNAGILKTGGGKVTISGGTIAVGANEFVVRADGTSDKLVINSIFTGSGGVTKSGAGSLTLNPQTLGAVTFTGTATTSGQTTLQLAASTQTSQTVLVPGMAVNGPGIPAGTTVASVSGSTVNLNFTLPATSLTATSPIALSYPTTLDTTANVNTYLPLTAAQAGTLTVGQIVTGVGIAPNTTIASFRVTANVVDGVILSAPVTASVPLETVTFGGSTLAFGNTQNFTLTVGKFDGEHSTTTINSNVLTIAAQNPTLVAGMSVESPLLPSGTTILSIANQTVTLSQVATQSSDTVFGAVNTYLAQVGNGQTTTSVTPAQAQTLKDGALVTGVNIAPGTTFTRNGTTVTFSAPARAQQTFGAVAVPANSTTITLTPLQAAGLFVNTSVSGTGFQSNTVITAIDTTTGVVTLNRATNGLGGTGVTFGALSNQSLTFGGATITFGARSLVLTPAQAATVVVGSTVTTTAPNPNPLLPPVVTVVGTVTGIQDFGSYQVATISNATTNSPTAQFVTFGGNATVVINAAYGGSTLVNSGTFAVSASGLSSGPVSISAGAELAAVSSIIPNAITLNGTDARLSAAGGSSGGGFSGPITATSNDFSLLARDFDTKADANLLVSGAITGTGRMTVPTESAGIVTLTGNNSGFTGPVTIGSGARLSVARLNSLTGNSVELAAGVLILALDGDGGAAYASGGNGTGAPQPLSLLNNIAITGSGTLQPDRDGTSYGSYFKTAGNKTVRLNQLKIDAETLTVQNNAGSGVEFMGVATMGGASTFSVVNATASNVVQGLTFTGKLTGGGNTAAQATFVKTGSGTLVLGNVANDFGGNGSFIDVQAGVLSAGSDAVFGEAANGINLNWQTALGTVATLRATGTFSTPRTISLSGTSNVIEVTGGNLFTVASPFSLPVNFESNPLAKAGNGTLFIAADNSGGTPWNGPVTINAGALRLQNANALGTATSAVIVARTGAALQITGGANVANRLTISGSGVGSAGALQGMGAFTNVASGQIILSGATSIGADTGSTLNITGGITGTNGVTLTLNSAGNMNITGSALDPAYAITGDLGLNSTTITNVGNTANVLIGMGIKGPNIQSGTTVTGFGTGPGQLTISRAATATTSGTPLNAQGFVNLVKIGAGTATLGVNSPTFVGSIQVNQGGLVIGGNDVSIGTPATANTTFIQEPSGALTVDDSIGTATVRMGGSIFPAVTVDNSRTLNLSAAQAAMLVVGQQVFGANIPVNNTIQSIAVDAAGLPTGVITLTTAATGAGAPQTVNFGSNRNLTLTGGTLIYNGNAAGSSEIFGTLTTNRGTTNSIQSNQGGAGAVVLNFANLVLNGDSNIDFQGVNLGTASNRILFYNAAPGLTPATSGILQRATINGNSFVSYNNTGGSATQAAVVNGNGIQAFAAYNTGAIPLTTPAVAANLDTFDVTNATVLATGPMTINAFRLNGNNISFGGTSNPPLTLTAGAILSTGGVTGNTVGLPLVFGGTQAFVAVDAGGQLTLNSLLTGSGGFVKALAGTLQLNSPDDRAGYANLRGQTLNGNFEVNAGTLKLGGGNNALTPNNFLIVASGATLDLNGTTQFALGTRGDGATLGTPNINTTPGNAGKFTNTNASPAALILGADNGGVNFGGVITQSGGAGAMSFLKASAQTYNFYSNNDYAGATVFAGGINELRDYGQLSATSSIALNYARLAFNDDVLVAQANRVSLAAPFTMRGGSLTYANGRQQTELTQAVGAVTIAEGLNFFQAQIPNATGVASATLSLASLSRPAGSAATVRFADLNPANAGVLNFGALGTIGNAGRITIGTLNGTATATAVGANNNLIGPWAVVDREFASYIPTLGVGALSTTGFAGYSPNFLNRQPLNTDNIRATISVPGLALDTTVNTLAVNSNLAAVNGVPVSTSVDLGGFKLTLAGGGMILALSGDNQNITVQNGTITSGLAVAGGVRDLYLHALNYGGNNRTFTVSAGIVDNGAPVRLVKSSGAVDAGITSATPDYLVLTGTSLTFGGSVIVGGSTTAGSNSVAVVSTTGITVGMSVTGSGLPANEFVTGISGNTVTISTGSGVTTRANNNTYTGGTVINAGNLLVGAGGNIPAGGITIGGGEIAGIGALIQDAGGVIASSNTVTLNGLGSLILSGNNTLAGLVFNDTGIGSAVSNAAPTVTTFRPVTALGTGTLTLGGGGITSTPLNPAAPATVAGRLDFGALPSTVTVNAYDFSTFTDFAPTTAGLILQGVVGSAGNITKAGAGVLQFNAQDVFTGQLIVAAGTVQIGGFNAGSRFSRLNLSSATSRLNLNGQTTVLGSLASLPGNGIITSTTGAPTLTVGFDNTSTSFGGQFSRFTDATPNAVALIKVGTGTLTMTSAQDGTSGSSGGVTVNGGGLTYSGAGKAYPSTALTPVTYNVNTGGTLTIDNAGTATTDRLGLNASQGTLNLNGGTFATIANSVGSVENVNILNFGASASTIQLTPTLGGTTTINVTGPFGGQNGQDSGLITGIGTGGNVVVTGAYAVPGSQGASSTGNTIPIRPDLLGDATVGGSGTGFITLDAASKFLRPLDPVNELSLTMVTASSDGVFANVGLTSANNATDNRIIANQTINSLTMLGAGTPSVTSGLGVSAGVFGSNGAPLTIALGSGGVLALADATIGVGAITTGGTTADFHVVGGATVLTLNSSIVSTSSGIVKADAGTLVLNARQYYTGGAGSNGTTVNGGTLRLGGGNNTILVQPTGGIPTVLSLFMNGGTLDLNGNSQIVESIRNNNAIAGTGGVIINGTAISPAVTLTSATGLGTTFAGSIGSGLLVPAGNAINFTKSGNSILTLTNVNTYTGSTVVRGGGITLQDSGTLAQTGTLVGSSVAINFGTLLLNEANLNPLGLNPVRIPAAAPITLNGGTIQQNSGGSLDAASTFNVITLASGGSTITQNTAQNAGSSALVNIGSLVQLAASATVNLASGAGTLGGGGLNNNQIQIGTITPVGGTAAAPASLLVNGMLPAWITANNGADFAGYLASPVVGSLGVGAIGSANFPAYTTIPRSPMFPTITAALAPTIAQVFAVANSADNLSLTVAGSTPVVTFAELPAAGRRVNSIAVRSPGGNTNFIIPINLPTDTVSIGTGGLLINAANAGTTVTIQGGRITAGAVPNSAATLYLTSNGSNTQTINSQIVDNGNQVFSANTDGISNVVTVGNTSGLVLGQVVNGLGIPNNSVITGITAPSGFITGAVTSGGNGVIPVNSITGVAVGMTVSGNGLSAGQTVTAVGPGNQITVSNAAGVTPQASTTLTFTGTNAGSTSPTTFSIGSTTSAVTFNTTDAAFKKLNSTTLAGSTAVTVPSAGNLAVGMYVTGPAIPAGTVVTSLGTVAAPNVITLSNAPTASMSQQSFFVQVGGNTNQNILSLTPAQASTLTVGMAVSGGGNTVPANTTISAINLSTGKVTLSNSTTGVVSTQLLSFAATLNFARLGTYVAMPANVNASITNIAQVTVNNTTGLVAGMPVSGPGIPAGTVIAAFGTLNPTPNTVPNNTTVFLQAPVGQNFSTVNSTGLNLVFGSGVSVGNNSTGAVALVKTGSGTVTLTPQLVINGSLDGSGLVIVPSTVGLIAGMTVSGAGIPAGSFIESITSANSFVLSNPSTTPTIGVTSTNPVFNAATAQLSFGPGNAVIPNLATTAFSNTYTGGTFINQGALNLAGFAGTTVIPGDLVINNATVSIVSTAITGTTTAGSKLITLANVNGLSLGMAVLGTGVPDGEFITGLAAAGNVLVAGATTTAGSNIISVPTTAGLVIGMAVGGGGLPAGEFITAISPGQITITSGTNVQARSNTNLTSPISQVTVTTGTGVAAVTNSSLSFGNAQQIAGTSNVTLNGGGVLNLFGTNTLASVTFNNNGGNVTPTVSGADRLTLTAANAVTVVNDTLSFTPSITGRALVLSNGAPVINTSGLSPDSLLITAPISSSVPVTKSGLGSLILTPNFTLANSVTTAASNTITVPSTAALSVGMLVTGTGIPNPVATTATTTAGTSTITVPSTAGLSVGMAVFGPAIPSGEFITAVGPGNQITVTTGTGITAATNGAVRFGTPAFVTSITGNTINVTPGVGATAQAATSLVFTGSTSPSGINLANGSIVLGQSSNQLITAATTANGNNTITVASTAGLSPGMLVTGTGIPAGEVITAVGSGQITVTTGVGVTAQGTTLLTFSGGSSIFSGPLGTGPLNMANDTALLSDGTLRTIGNAVNIAVNATFGPLPGNGVALAGNGVNLSGSVTLTGGGAHTITVPDLLNVTTISGQLNGSGGSTLSLTKAGTGTLVLSNPTNLYPTPGGNPAPTSILVTGGVLRLGSATAVPTGVNLSVSAGAEYDISGNASQVLNGLSNPLGSGGVVTNSGGSATLFVGGTSTSDTLSNVGITSTFDGIITAATTGNLSLTKVGKGTQVLTGANLYTGPTTVLSGSLIVNGSLANTAVTVQAGASLGGTGSIGNALGGSVTLAGGSAGNRGTFDLRNGSIGIFTLNNGLGQNALTVGGGGQASSLIFDISNNAADRIEILGSGRLNANTGAAVVDFNQLPGTTLANGIYNLITFTGIPTYTGTFTLGAGLPGTFALSQTPSALVLNVGGVPLQFFWKGNLDNIWSTGGASNWVRDVAGGAAANAIPNATSVVNFNATTPANFSTTLGTNFTIDSLLFNTNSTSTLTIGGPNTLTLNNNLAMASGTAAVIISTGGLVLGSPQTWNNAATTSLTVSAPVTGSSPLTIASSSSGTVILSGNNSNFNGGITVNGNGTNTALILGSATALGAVGVPTNSLVVNNGALDMNGQSVTVSSLSSTANTGIIKNGAAAIGNSTLSVIQSGTTTYSGVLQDPGAGKALTLIVDGGGTLQLIAPINSNTSTYSGGTIIGTTVAGATLRMGNGGNERATALGTGLVTINGGGILNFAPGNTTAVFNIPNSIALVATAANGGGQLTSSGGNQHIANNGAGGLGTINITTQVNTSATITPSPTSGQDLFLDGQLTGSGSLAVGGSGSGKVILTNNTSGNVGGYTGRITSTGSGNLQLAGGVANSTALQNADLFLNTNANGLSFLSPVTSATFGSLAGGGNIALQNTATAAVALTIGGTGASTSFTGLITNPTATTLGSLTKIGGGTFILGNGASNYGPNTYRGTTTVAAGEFRVNSASTTASVTGFGNVQVTGTATLGGTGVIQGGDNVTASVVTLGGGTFLDPGLTAGAFGTLRIGVQTGVAIPGGLSTFTLTGGVTPSTYKFDVGAGAPSQDRVSVVGSAAISGAKLAINLVSTPDQGDYPLLTTTNGVTGQFSGGITTSVNLGAPAAGAPQFYSVVYNANTVDLQRFSTIGTVGTPAGLQVIRGASVPFPITVQNSAPAGSSSLSFFATAGTNTTGTVASAGSPIVVGAGSTNPDPGASGLSFNSAAIGSSGTFTGNFTVSASNANSTNSSVTGTVSVQVLDHAAFAGFTGGGLTFQPVRLGYVGPVNSTSSLSVTNTAGLRVDLKGSVVSPPPGNVSLNSISGIVAGTTGSITASLASGQGAGHFTQGFTYSLGDDSTLNGSNNGALGTVNITVDGDVYTGQGIWGAFASGPWGTFNRWQAPGGYPGIDGAASINDTALFGSTFVSTTLDGVAPSLNALTFNSTSGTIAPGTGVGSGPVTLQNNSTGVAPVLNVTGGALPTISAPMVFGNTVTVSTATVSDRLTISGVIDGPGGLTKTGAGTLFLSGTNTYLGKTAVNGGTLSVASEVSLGAPVAGLPVPDQISIDNAAHLAFTDNATILPNQGITVGSGNATLDVAANKTVVVNSVITGTLSGTATNVGTLTKSGSGTMNLRSNIQASALGLTAPALNVDQGTLSIVAGPWAGGVTATSDLQTGTVNFNGGTLALNIQGSGGRGVVNGNDLLSADNGTGTGTSVRITAPTNLSITLGTFAPIPGDSFTFISDATRLSTDAYASFFRVGGANATQGTIVSAGGYYFTIDYHAGSGGNDIALLSVVPEPGTAALLFGAVGILGGVVRRRRSRNVPFGS